MRPYEYVPDMSGVSDRTPDAVLSRRASPRPWVRGSLARWLVLVMLVAGAGGVATVVLALRDAHPVQLLARRSGSSAPSLPLAGASCIGATAIVVEPAAGVRQVHFWIDGISAVPTRTDVSAPFDLLVADRATGERLRDAHVLEPGRHRVDAVVDLADGSTKRISASFSLVTAEDAGSLSWDDAWRSADVGLLHRWYVEHTGPTRPLAELPLRGLQVVQDQRDADALVGRVVEGSVEVRASGVWLHDFAVHGDGTRELLAVRGALRGVRLSDIEVDGRGAKSSAGLGGSSFASVSVERLDVHDVGFDGVRLMAGSSYRQLYVHDLWQWDERSQGRAYDGSRSQDTDPHTDGLQAVGGSDTLVEESWIDVTGGGANFVSAIFLSPDAAPLSGWTIRHNYHDGGGYVLHVHNQSGDVGRPGPNGNPRGIQVRDNRFGRGFTDGLYSKDDVPADAVRSVGNVWADTLRSASTRSGPLR